jgi:bla regulator protein blaR1
MIPVSLSSFGNHLWQSSVCAGAAWLLTLALRKNRAALRYGLWFTASVKFLVPFSLLVGVGSQVGWRTPPAIIQPAFSSVVAEVSQPFALNTSASVATPAPNTIPAIFSVIWFCGVTIGVVFWLRWWGSIHAARRSARPLSLNLPIPVLSSTSRLEPGIFGILRPVLLLPEGIADRLTSGQLHAVIAHELCHARRRDNLTAAIHMVVETIFWFHPLVWWIRERLVEERERACDEEVVKLSDPQEYAEGILNVCKFYLESPLVCASGVTGSDLKKRIEKIMTHHVAHRLDLGRKALLAIAGAALVAGPFVVGLMNAPASLAQAHSTDGAGPAFEVASVKANKSGIRGGQLNTDPGRLTITNIPLRTCIKAAYGLQDYQLSGGSVSIPDERYDIVAKAEAPVGDDQLMLMLRTLLVDRFKLTMRQETKEMQGHALVVGKNGPKLHEVEAAGKGWWRNGVGSLNGQEISMPRLAEVLSARLGHPVVDQTGIKGVFDIKLEWTPDPAMVKNPAENKENPAVESTFDPSGPSVFSALQEQLGLRLEVRKVPADVFVIDHLERPAEN